MSYDHRAFEYEKERIKALKKSIFVAELVSVIKVNEDSTLNVQPLCKILINGNYESRPMLINVPVLKHRDAGSSLVTPAYQEGDIGLVVYCNHDIDNILLSKSESEPATDRLHSADDGIFIGVI